MTFARTSLILLGIQLAIVTSIAAKYLYQRSTCPRVWTRAVAYDPEMVMRGRYISAQLHIDACGINLPIARDRSFDPQDGRAYFDPDGNGTVSGQLPVIVGVKDGKLVAERIASSKESLYSPDLTIRKGAPCSDAALWPPVDFYLSEAAKSPFPLAAGQQLWVEVTVPPKGPPRPLGLALKNAVGQWQPLNYR
jgi:hypothetical protein